jgi:predicted PurR-regulated permease PerM
MTTLLAAGLVIAGLYFGREILVPFALAVLLSFLLAPVLRGLHRIGIGRVAGVAMTVAVAILAIAGFAAMVIAQLSPLAHELPAYERNVERKISSLPQIIPGAATIGRLSDMLNELRGELAQAEATRPKNALGHAPSQPRPVPVEIRSWPATPLGTLKNLIGPLLVPLASGGLVMLFVIWILLNREDLRDRVLAFGGGDLHRTTQAMNDAADRVSRYLATQLAVNTACALPIGIGLAAIGIPYPALWAAMVMLLRFLPYLGILIAASFPLALALAIAPGWGLVAWTALLFLAVELVVSNLIEPRLYGARVGVSPLAVVVAAVFWTWLWGSVGLLLSMPLTVCLVVLGRHIPQLGFLGMLFGDEPPLSAEQTLYQRLLAGDPEEATEQAEEFINDRSPAEFFGTVVLPALMLAQADSDRGVLSGEKRAMVAHGIETMLDNLSEELSREPSPPATSGKILCMAGRNELDEAAASVLLHLVRLDGGDAELLPAPALAEAERHPRAMRNAALICLSVVSTGSQARARYLVRRLRRRAPQARLLVGLWGGQPELLGVADAAGAASPVSVVTSLRDAAREILAAPATAGVTSDGQSSDRGTRERARALRGHVE